jgi:hypothetical protein
MRVRRCLHSRSPSLVPKSQRPVSRRQYLAVTQWPDFFEWRRLAQRASFQ